MPLSATVAGSCRRRSSRTSISRRVGPLPSSKVAGLFGDLVFGDGEVFGLQTADVVSLVVGDGDVELHQHDADADARGVILGRRSGSAAGERDCK